MTKQNPQNVPKWLGPVFVVLGILPMLVAKPADDVPLWVAFAAGLLFVFAGFILTGMGFGVTWVSEIFGPLIVLLFAVIASWIAFAPGERQCSSSDSFFGFAREGTSSCTVPFGIGAVVCWLIFLVAICSIIKRLRNKITGKKPKY